MKSSTTAIVLFALCCIAISCLADSDNNNNNNSDGNKHSGGSTSEWSITVPKKLKPRDFRDTSGPTQPGDNNKEDWVADFVIIGSGAGGASVARGLIDAGFSVIILEAGDYEIDNQDIWDPIRASSTYGAKTPVYGWQMKSAVEDFTKGAFQVNLAKTFGGSTAHNGMQYVRGSRAYFDQVATFGGPTWSADAVYDAYYNMETYINEETESGLPGRGVSGPVNVRRPAVGPAQGLGSLANHLYQWSVEASGIPGTPDYNGATQAYGPIPRYDLFQTPNRTRTSSASAFLGPNVVTDQGLPAGYRKIRVFFKTHAVKVLFNKFKKAVAVDASREGYTERYYANFEVIVSANIRSSQILENSGVGDASILSSFGIPVIYNNTNVGKHLNNHPSGVLVFLSNPADGGITTPQDPDGLYAGGGFYPAVDINGDFEAIDNTLLRKFQILWLDTGVPGTFGLFTMLANPVSLGESHTQGKDPFKIPLLKEGAFSQGDDLDVYARFLYYFIQNNLTAVMTAHDPAYRGTWTHWNSVNDAKAWLVSNNIRASHFVGLNRMAPSAQDGVVDYAGRVFGVTGLRVVDTSILPTACDGNTGASGMMIGMRIAGMIINYYR